MILADKIMNLRKKNGWSQEDLAGMLGVSRQSVSKWESAQSMPDLNRILQMAELFGVSTDFLLKEEMEESGAVGPVRNEISTMPEDIEVRAVSMEEASTYLKLIGPVSDRIAAGVFLCIISPIVLLVLGAAAEEVLVRLTDNQAGGIGLAVLLLLIAGAVALFIINGMKTDPYDFLEKEPIETEYGVDGMVRERMGRYQDAHHLSVVLGVVLCILAVIPVTVFMSMEGSDFAGACSVGFLLLLVASGTFLLVRTGMRWEAMQKLLEEGDYTREHKEESARNAPFVTIYWLSATGLYLLLSFLTGAWHRTWIVWPVAGVMFGVLVALLRIFRGRR